MNTPARRVPVPDDPARAFAVVEQPGDYCGPVDDANGVSRVYLLLPGSRDEGAPYGLRSVHSVTSPPWEFRECADGSLEIRASIAAGDYWHGFLDEGNVWRQV